MAAGPVDVGWILDSQRAGCGSAGSVKPTTAGALASARLLCGVACMIRRSRRTASGGRSSKSALAPGVLCAKMHNLTMILHGPVSAYSTATPHLLHTPCKPTHDTTQARGHARGSEAQAERAAPPVAVEPEDPGVTSSSTPSETRASAGLLEPGGFVRLSPPGSAPPSFAPHPAG